MKANKMVVLVAIALVAMAGVAHAKVKADFSASYCEVVDSQTIRVRNISNVIESGTSMPGDYVAEFTWHPKTSTFNLKNIGADTPGIISNPEPIEGWGWSFNWDENCSGVPPKTGVGGITFHTDGTFSGNYGEGAMDGSWEMTGKNITLNAVSDGGIKNLYMAVLTGTLNHAFTYMEGTYSNSAGYSGCWKAVKGQ